MQPFVTYRAGAVFADHLVDGDVIVMQLGAGVVPSDNLLPRCKHSTQHRLTFHFTESSFTSYLNKNHIYKLCNEAIYSKLHGK